MRAPDPAAHRDLVAPAVRFLVAGALTTGLSFIVFRLFLYLLTGREGAAGAAQVGAYAIGIAVSYAANSRWTFRDGAAAGGAPGPAAAGGALPRFVAAHLGSLALSAALIQGGVSLLGLSPSLCWLAATGVTTVINFAAQRYWVFARRPARGAPPALR